MIIKGIRRLVRIEYMRIVFIYVRTVSPPRLWRKIQQNSDQLTQKRRTSIILWLSAHVQGSPRPMIDGASEILSNEPSFLRVRAPNVYPVPTRRHCSRPAVNPRVSFWSSFIRILPLVNDRSEFFLFSE